MTNPRRPRASGDPELAPGMNGHEQGATDRNMSEKRPCVYILASKRNGTLYTGVTSDIARRAWQHRSKLSMDLFAITECTA